MPALGVCLHSDAGTKTEAWGIVPVIYDKAELDATAYLHSYPTREPKTLP